MPFVFSSPEPITKARGPGARWVARIAMHVRRKFQAPLLLELAALKGKVPTSKLAQAVLDQNEAHVLELSRVDRVGAIVASYDEPLTLGLVEGGKLAVTDLGVGVALDMQRPRIADWIKEHSAELVRQVNGTSREAVRSILIDGYKRGRHPRALAKDIRQVVGLTDPQSIAVARRRQAMLEAGIPEARIEKVTNRYAEKLLKQRAQTIAGHETMTAISRGRHELWQQLAEEGALEPGVQQQWETSVDEATCSLCGPMHGQKTPLNGSFTAGDGSFVDHPPLHVGCRCVAILVG